MTTPDQTAERQGRCECVYATAENTASVRMGYDVGGYVKKECEHCRTRRLATPDQTADRTRDVADAAEYRTMLGKYVDHCEPGGSVQIREDIAQKIASLLARLAEEIETLRRERDDWRKAFEKHLDARVKAEAALTAAQEENARLREALDCALGEFEIDNGQIIDDNCPHWSVVARHLLTGLPTDMPAGGGEPVAWQSKSGPNGKWSEDEYAFDPEFRRKSEAVGKRFRPLYAAPPAPAPDWEKAVEAGCREIWSGWLDEWSEARREIQRVKVLHALRAAAPHLGVVGREAKP